MTEWLTQLSGRSVWSYPATGIAGSAAHGQAAVRAAPASGGWHAGACVGA